MDVSITAANVQNSDLASIIEADAAIELYAGKLVYKTLNGRFGLADANGTTPSFKLVGITIDSANVDQPAQVCIEDPNFIPGGILIPGKVYVLSATPGFMCPVEDQVPGMKSQVVGVAKSTTILNLKIVRSDTEVPS